MPELSALVGQDFAYAAGRTGVLQQFFLTTSDRDRLLGAHDIAEVESILTELKMTNPIDQGLHKADDILHAIGQWILKEVKHMSPESKYPIFQILFLEEDAPVIAYLLKKHHGFAAGISVRPHPLMSAYDLDALTQLMAENTEGKLPTHLVEFVRQMKERDDLTPQVIDHAVAQYVATTQLQLARSSGSKHIEEYVQHRIDMNNVRTALRTGAEYNDDLFISGGTLDLKRLSGEPKDIIAALDRSRLSYNLSSVIIEGKKDTSVLEFGISNITAYDIAKMWNMPLSIEPVFAFAALALQQLKVLRAIVIGKRATLSPQQIKQMLPPFLPATHYVS